MPKRSPFAAALGTAILAAFAAGAVAAETARVHGKIVDARGNAMAGFPLRVSEEGGRGVELRTKHDGTFSAIGLTPGAIVVTLEGATYQRSRATCHVNGGMTARVTFTAIAGLGSVTQPCHIEPPTTDVYILK